MFWGVFWVGLWAGGVLAFLYFFLGRRLLWVFLAILGLIGFVALVIVGGWLEEVFNSGGYGYLIEAASQLGWRIFMGAIIVFVADMAVMAIYTIQHGQSEAAGGSVITDKRPMAMSLGLPRPMGRSRRKILGSKSGFVTMKSLADRTATRAEWKMLVGIITAVASFYLIFVGVALMGMRTNMIALGILVVPAWFSWNFSSTTWRAYQRAKAGLPEDEEEGAAGKG